MSYPNLNSFEKFELCSKAAWVVLKDEVHLFLDACGLVPGGGEACDAANGVLYTLEGDGLNASLSFAAMVPFLGWTATGGKVGLAIKHLGVTTILPFFKNANNVISWGNRGLLRTVLNITDPLKEAHHILPWTKAGGHPLVQKAGRGGWHMNHPKNGIPIEEYRINTNPNGTHANHPNYDNQILAGLDELKKRLEIKHGTQFSLSTAKEFVQKYQDNVKGFIESNITTKINDLNLPSTLIPEP